MFLLGKNENIAIIFYLLLYNNNITIPILEMKEGNTEKSLLYM